MRTEYKPLKCEDYARYCVCHGLQSAQRVEEPFGICEGKEDDICWTCYEKQFRKFREADNARNNTGI